MSNYTRRDPFGRDKTEDLSLKSNSNDEAQPDYNRLMRKNIVLVAWAFLLTSCDVWGIAPQPFPVLTPVPSNTPSIITPTPIIIPPPTLTNATAAPLTLVPTTDTPPPTSTLLLDTPSATNTQPIIQSVELEILGCDTGFDVQNGMFEVTNAYVTIKNTGTIDLENTCALLRAIDEGREHPDKKVCAGTLPVQNLVTLKLTVDSTYKQDTIIQVDVTTNELVLLRVDKQSCRDINLLGGAPADTGVIKPIP